ncbi:unnamed protein product [Ectocarpus fasciculatus]
MSTAEIEGHVKQVYSQPHTKFSLLLTGGGTQVLPWLLTVPGASSCLLEGNVPYATTALRSLLGKAPVQYCSESTAADMARVALKRNATLLLEETRSFQSLTENNVFGVACTAALVSSSPKRGPHRCFVASASPGSTTVASVELMKGERGRTRVGEDYVCSRLVLEAVAGRSGLPPMPRDYLIDAAEEGSESVTTTETENRAEDHIQGLLDGRSTAVLAVPSRCGASGADPFVLYEDVDLPGNTIVFPGSFNPVHEGHVLFAASVVGEMNKREEASPLVVFEISVTNADKPPLSSAEILRRLNLFSQNNPMFSESGLSNYAVCLTTKPLFLGKTEIFKGCRFLVGSDTMVRLLNTKYYSDSNSEMLVALSSIAERKCSFIVAGRVEQNSSGASAPEFLTCDGVLERVGGDLPGSVVSLFEGLPESTFRSDISSTEIREQINSEGRK